MNKNNENIQEAEFEPIVETSKKNERNSAWDKAKRLGKTALKCAVIGGLGYAVGYVSRKYIDKDIYEDARAQREWRERKQGNGANN